MLSVLACVLKPAILWLNLNIIKSTLPICFKDFNNVVVVIDCTEISIEKPKCLCCRLKLYSPYKSTHTIKFLTGISPAGVIMFVSRAYGGRASDKQIFEQSNIETFLKCGEDEIMTDKGFLIDDICNSYNIKIVRPPILKNCKQLSADNCDKNVKIARCRVHIERVFQRIKIFKILNTIIPLGLVSKIEDIFHIICGITNLSAPVLSVDKFDLNKT